MFSVSIGAGASVSRDCSVHEGSAESSRASDDLDVAHSNFRSESRSWR